MAMPEESKAEVKQNEQLGEQAEAALDAPAGEEPETQEVSPADLLAQKDEEIKALRDRVLRLAAETENTRKRLEREKSEGICFANESLIRELIPVIDNLERTVQHGEKDADFESLMTGVRMTLKGFLGSLSKFGCVPFDSAGKPFDPKFHEAVMQEESSEVPENTVVQEFQRGYTLNDRLVRPALVVVSKASKANAAD